MTSQDKAKQKIGRRLAERAEKNQVIGAGSGSTSMIALKALANRNRAESLNLRFIPTSYEIETACFEHGLQVTSLNEKLPDWCFDGADEIDPDNNMIKGRGGAMMREKIVMRASSERVILVDPSKFVQKLGQKFPVPVECRPEARQFVLKILTDLGAVSVVLRAAGGKDGPVITEAGNVILDAHFNDIETGFEKEISSIPGVIDSGLFQGYKPQVLTAE